MALENGDELHAPLVVTTLHPKTAFLEQLDAAELPATFVRDIETWKTRSGVVKINLALAELPNFTADPGSNQQEHHTGSVEMAPSVEYIERAFQDAREGRPALRPFSDSVIPTTFDKTLCTRGHAHHVAVHPVGAAGVGRRAAQGRARGVRGPHGRLLRRRSRPTSSSSILHRDIVGPYEMEQEYGLIGGNIFHGELSLEQLFHMRPAPGYADYRTPVKGLYNGSSATHAGGGVCGIPGYQAARAALSDRKSVRNRLRPGK